ncbi:hypothetical protein B296_00002512 [Ensete ventricosum]|uniref:Uncharacterized protein n=1 Tax=Ensete ventricosum TaxID=4639 RepID=A0A427ADT8_ENSVE|nr:hypothetical protein B296_00002512 [Ensete ventricosum]
MARKCIGLAGHGLAPCWGDRPWLGHLQGGDRLWPRPLAKGRPLVGAVVLAVGAAASGQGQSPPTQGRWRRSRRGVKAILL